MGMFTRYQTGLSPLCEQQLCMSGWSSLQPQQSISRGEHYGPEMGLAAPLLEHFHGEPNYFIKYAMVSNMPVHQAVHGCVSRR